MKGSIEEELLRAMLRDRHRLRRWWVRLCKSDPNAPRATAAHHEPVAANVDAADPPSGSVIAFQHALQHSQQVYERRRASMPQPIFDQELPVLAHRDAIIKAIQTHPVTVICGETGSGKSTQLPQICIAAGFGIAGVIGHTQPRRIAARSIAERLAVELHTTFGKDVGFKIRFTDKTDADTKIKLMTDGILLAETQGDRYLNEYEVIILDEAHERSLNIDFLLGYFHQLLPKRPDLRLIITSATIDAERFAEHFSSDQRLVPILQVSGRSYPVEVRYRSPQEFDVETSNSSANDTEEQQTVRGIVAALHELSAIDRGDILVFLPTERDIRELAKRLRGEQFAGDGIQRTEILPLYARLSTAEQNRIFQPHAYRRIVLATNVAESSLTVPGIRYVVDTGTARISRYAPKSKIQRLPIEPVSRASADQRKGRCGRVAPGICIRLYGEEDYASRADYTTPEIQRTNLASVILQAASLNLGPVERFPFLDPPRPESIRDGYRTLFEIGAVDERHHLTERGRRLSRLPVDPRIGRIILAAHEESCLADVLIIAAALETQDPRDRPYERRQLADERHAQFHDDRSDFLSYLKIWDFYHDLKERLSRNQLQRACINNFLSPTRLREWTEVHRQLMQLVANDRMSIGRRSNRYDAIHRALLAGYLSGVAMRTGDHEYTGAGGIKFHLWPGSCLLGSKPTWIVCGELVETSRRFGRTVAKIEPDWIERLAQHLVKRHYSEPHWYDKTGAVMAHERVTLWGLPIVAQRRVHYHKIDPVAAREIFIREGLRHSVGHVWEAAERDENGAADPRRALQFAFFRHNEQTLRDVERLASRSRRADLLVDQFKLYRFYDARIPSDVCDLDRLRRWLKGSPDNEHLLTMSPGDFDDADVSDKGTANFPDTVTLGILDLPAHYHFEPGADDDGVTLDVPQAALAQLTEGQLAWLVPGVLEEKLTAIIRALPKGIRRNLIPAPDTARQVAAELTFGEGDFWTAVLGAFSRIAGEPIEMSSVRLDKLPPHLRMNVRVLDDEGNAVAEGCDLKQLQNSITFDAPTTSSSVAIDQRWHRDALTSWDLGELPEQVLVRRGSIDVPAYPALVDNHADVQLRLFDNLLTARWQHRQGLRRLYALIHAKSLRSQVRWLPDWNRLTVLASRWMTPEQLKEQVLVLIADRAFLSDRGPLPRDQSSFESRSQNAIERIGQATQDVAKLLPNLLDAHHQVQLQLEQKVAEKLRYAVHDVRQQLSQLTSPAAFSTTPWEWLAELPRFFLAMRQRLQRLGNDTYLRDKEQTATIAGYWKQYEEASATPNSMAAPHPELQQFRWMIEELRVSLFAQQLGTSITVSPQRLERQWQKYTKTTRLP